MRVKSSPIEKVVKVKNIVCEMCLNKATLSVLFIQDSTEDRKKKKEIIRRFMCSKECADAFKVKYS